MRIFYKFKLLIIVLMCQLFCITIYSQKKTAIVARKVPKIVAESISFFDSLSNVQNKSMSKSSKAVMNKLTGAKLKHAANLIYSASAADYQGYMDSLLSIGKRIVEKNRKMGTHLYPPGFFRLQTLHKIRDSLSPVVYGLAVSAYLFRIQVDSVRQPSLSAQFTLINGIIKEIFKGSSMYKVGDKIEFYYYNYWVLNGPPGILPQFKIGHEYLVPLEPRKGGHVYPGYKPIALIMYLDDSNGFYPIENGYLTDAYNFFRLGKEVEYNVFDKKLRDKIEEIKSW